MGKFVLAWVSPCIARGGIDPPAVKSVFNPTYQEVSAPMGAYVESRSEYDRRRPGVVVAKGWGRH